MFTDASPIIFHRPCIEFFLLAASSLLLGCIWSGKKLIPYTSTVLFGFNYTLSIHLCNRVFIPVQCLTSVVSYGSAGTRVTFALQKNFRAQVLLQSRKSLPQTHLYAQQIPLSSELANSSVLHAVLCIHTCGYVTEVAED